MAVSSPFRIEGPAVVSFSGGRTSGYMLRRILDEGLQPDVHVCFANTGKERPETLDFIHQIERRWRVPIVWIEYVRKYLPKQRSKDRIKAARRARAFVGRTYAAKPAGKRERGFRIVTYATASRNGEPFENLIDLVALPNVTTRLCTSELKVRVMKKYMLRQGYTAWDNVVGIRADEPKRVARMRAPTGQRWDNVLPLADAQIMKADVLAFWKASSFDLRLPLDANGETYQGNCDLCFLKATGKRQRIALETPQAVKWWATQEKRTGMFFRDQRASYANLQTCAVTNEDDDLGDCICHD